jgi:uncharacterized repeat protein (TIGR01451 family)
VSFTVSLENSGGSQLVVVPLSVTFDGAFLTFVSAAPPPDDAITGRLTWNDLTGPSGLAPGGSLVATLYFQAVASTNANPNRTTTVAATVAGASNDLGQTAPMTTSAAPVRITAPGLTLTKQLNSPWGSVLSIGQLATYTVHITNTGDTLLQTLPVADQFDPTTLEFVTASPLGFRVAADGSRQRVVWDDLTASVGDLDAGQTVSATLSFSVSAVAPTIDNIAMVHHAVDAFGDVPAGQQASVSVPVAAMALTASASPPAGSLVRAGERITYTIVTHNAGSATLHHVIITSTTPPGAVIELSVAGNITEDGCAVPPATEVGDEGAFVRWRLDLLSPQTECVTRLQVRVKDMPLVAAIVNHSGASAVEIPRPVMARLEHLVAPTAITLVEFTAQPTPKGALIAWSTAVEIETWGFHLWRSESDRRNEAVRITQNLVLSHGATSNYSYLDEDAPHDRTLYYWLEEVDAAGRSEVYGPVIVGGNGASGLRLLLPLIFVSP